MINKLLAVARKWLGYKEKSSNTQLEDFSANVGYGNFTIFNHDYNQYLAACPANEEWCWTFIVMCLYYTFGREKTKEYLDGTFNLYSFIAKGQYRIPAKNNKPQPGDIAVFFDITKQAGGHVGLVSGVTTTTFTTIEGNIPGKNNGGEVVTRSYSLNYPYIYYYCRPLYNKIHLGDRTISRGNSGNDVYELQQYLIKLGYDCGNPDGYFGSTTAAAVKVFQKATSLMVDGIVGKNTALKITQDTSIQATTNIEVISRVLRYGLIGYDVLWLQTQLTDLGYPCNGLDGIFGASTQYAVKAFQKSKALTADGIAGAQTIAALGGVLQ